MPQGGTRDRADATSYPVDAPHGGNGFCGGNVPGGTNGPTLISAGRRCAEPCPLPRGVDARGVP
jgi:hypothetical protein